MEESEKRRERLKAMRIEAAQAELSNSQPTSTMPAHLSNPLIEPSSISPAADSSAAGPRFDFYTDPMSAFSSGKRRSKDSSHNPQDYLSSPITSTSLMGGSSSSSISGGPRSPYISPAPPYQFQMNYSPDQTLYETPHPIPIYGSWRSPIRMNSPFSGYRGTPTSVPGVWNHPGGMPDYGLPPNSTRGNLSSPSYGRGHSPRPNSGRGINPRYNNSPSPRSGWSGGRGRGSHTYASTREQPERFYNKSMLEDPWRLMKPVVRIVTTKNPKTPDSPNSWLPKSLSMKKAKVSEVPIELHPQSSLADCFALSFEEAVNDKAYI
ncbi:hydroxyproline-rich glycoprotein family protein [Tasmannia lanceolata]|uniref:hydroxyproline-rich glycoprotein family protein n=1 Tax=Tasmannia lanceolata TaxID=3420 RepID=UPI0040645582